MNVLFTGGGTGGHLSIAKALGIECKNRELGVIYVGSMSGQDRTWFENSDIFDKCYFLRTSGVVNKKGLHKIHSLFLQAKAMNECTHIFRAHGIKAVFSVGGFSAGGASMASVVRGIPLFIHEQNAIRGTLNAILSPFAKAIFGSFELDSPRFIRTSYPVHNDFFAKSRVRTRIKSILFLGGSQGARAINDFALDVAKDLHARGIKIIHQCGKNDFLRVQEEYDKRGIKSVRESADSAMDSRIDSESNHDENPACAGNLADSHTDSSNLIDSCVVDLFDFDSRIIDKIAQADFCVSRAGASSLWECCANGLSAYYVPYPFAAKNHQYFNALSLKKQGLCEVVPQSELDKVAFLRYIDNLDIEKISSKLIRTIENDGTKHIVDCMIERI